MVLEKSAKEKQIISKNRPAQVNDREDLLIVPYESSAAIGISDFESDRTWIGIDGVPWCIRVEGRSSWWSWPSCGRRVWSDHRIQTAFCRNDAYPERRWSPYPSCTG